MADPDNNEPKPISGSNPAVNVIRAKIDALYKGEPDATEEVTEAVASSAPHSKHQEYMYKLSTSGQSLAEIQTAWHNYYVGLSDEEKHEVWQEFYQEHERQKTTGPTQETPEQNLIKPHTRNEEDGEQPATVAEVKRDIVRRAFKDSKLAKNHHVRSIVFGLGMGSIVLLFLLFGFFNERFVAPFITPSRSVSSTPIIIDPESSAVSKDPKIIIPKINVEIPVVYDVSTKEKDIQSNLEGGVVHMSNTPKPGELGNSAIVGHSSNNIFNKGKYKFAFVLLKQLEKGDTFYVNRGGTRYVYKIYDKKIVAPTDISILGANDKPATVTLITCDPPGTSINRLIIVGEQISPDPQKNKQSSVKTGSETETPIVPSNAPSLWQRLLDVF